MAEPVYLDFLYQVLEEEGQLVKQFRESDMSVSEYCDRFDGIAIKLSPYEIPVSGALELQQIIEKEFGSEVASKSIAHENEHAGVIQKYGLTPTWGYYRILNGQLVPPEKIKEFTESDEVIFREIVPYVGYEEGESLRTWDKTKTLSFLYELSHPSKPSKGDKLSYE